MLVISNTKVKITNQKNIGYRHLIPSMESVEKKRLSTRPASLFSGFFLNSRGSEVDQRGSNREPYKLPTRQTTTQHERGTVQIIFQLSQFDILLYFYFHNYLN